MGKRFDAFMNGVSMIMKISVVLFTIAIGIAITTVISLIIRGALNTTSLSDTSKTVITVFSGIGIFVLSIGPIGYLVKMFGNAIPILFFNTDLGIDNDTFNDVGNLFSQ